MRIALKRQFQFYAFAYTSVNAGAARSRIRKFVRDDTNFLLRFRPGLPQGSQIFQIVT